ncbi:hypothetical protein DL93DRAFT_2057199 [Clavulina sp. PMI_390]|nr:hypothetical protein DL93DRAFT_2057199 [Clavulina sp. PMI_390]
MAHAAHHRRRSPSAEPAVNAAKNCSTKNSNKTKTPDTTTTATKNTTSTGSSYSIVEQWSGSTFFEGWNFYSSSDPTHGTVDYLSQSAAESAKLAYVSNGVAYMKVDSTSNLGYGQGRKSVRIASQKRFDGGLFIADILHMPTGLATWPAFWTVGQNWPNHGEIDIIETVNTNTQNQMTLHTASGCTIDTSSTAPTGFKVSAIASSLGSTTCGSSKSSNSGCAFIDSDKASAGAPFNAAGGGVFAMEWTSNGLKIWFFPRGSEPSDIASQNPNPNNWSTTYQKAAWSSHTCDTKKYFQQHAITFDTTLCGDWAGSAFSGGKTACEKYVQTGSHFKEAYWAINHVSVYQ